MTPDAHIRFRQWKSFQSRWTAANRLQKFLPGSVLLHAALALLLAFPAVRHRQEIEAREVSKVQEQEEKEAAEQKEKELITEAEEQKGNEPIREAEQQKEKEQIGEAAVAQTETLLKTEVARAQLEPLFSKLVDNVLSDELAKETWTELMAGLEPEIEGLAGMLEGDFDSVRLEEKVQDLKAQMVRKLAEMNARDRADSIREELQSKADEQAKQLAEFFNREIAAKVGEPAGEQLQQMLAQAEAARQQRLETAAKELAAALQAANQAAEWLDKSAARLDDGGQKLAGAGKAKNATGEKGAQSMIRDEKPSLLAAGEQITTARAAAARAAGQLAKGDGTERLGKALKKADAESGDAAATKTQSAADDAGETKASPAAAQARAAAAKAKQLAADVQAAKSDVQRQMQADSPEAGELARAIQQLRQGQFAKLVDERFGKLFDEKVVPGVADKDEQAAAKQRRAGPAVAEEFRGELKRHLEKVLGEGVKDQVRAGEQFAKGAGQKMPGKPGDPDVPGSPGDRGRAPGKEASELAAAAQANLAPIIERNLNAVVDAGLQALPAPTLGGSPSDADKRRAALADRLEALKNQLAVGRTDLLGDTNLADLAAARARFRSRQRGLGSLNHSASYIDVEAYKQAAEMMLKRGRIEGAEIDRRGAEGNISPIIVESAIRPALVSLSEKTGGETAVTAPVKRSVAAPAFPTNAFAGIPFVANDAIKIDGDLSDWKGIPELKLYPVQRGEGPKPDSLPEIQSARIAYCPRGLLVAVEAIDTSGKLENQNGMNAFWQNDCLEIYIDTINSKYSSRGEVNTHQFFAFPLGHRDHPEIGGYESYMVKGERTTIRPHLQNVLPRAGRASPGGKSWTMELLIPKSLLRQGEIQPGRIVGFNLQLDTGTSYYYFWSNPVKERISMRPNLWGDIQFLGSDAKLEILDPSDQPIHSLIPGQAARLRVVDPDMNLDDTRRDKVSVMVRSASGDSETMILEETDVRSGIFIGPLAIRLNIGRSQPGVLQVFEGEQVTIEYTDQARAFGERNVPVKLSVVVGSIGTTLVDK